MSCSISNYQPRSENGIGVGLRGQIIACTSARRKRGPLERRKSDVSDLRH
jgi:hypothetical protein